MSTNAENLLKAMKVTAGCRFNAAKRLQTRDKKVTLLTALITVFVIVLTIIPYFLKLPTNEADKLNALTVGFSILILASSLHQYSLSDATIAEQHHRCALEINELRRELEALSATATTSDILDFVDDYNYLLQKYSINHEDVDYLAYQLDRPEDHPWLTAFDRFLLRIKLLRVKYLTDTLLIISGVGFFLFVGLYIVPLSHAAN